MVGWIKKKNKKKIWMVGWIKKKNEKKMDGWMDGWKKNMKTYGWLDG